jgi:signal transduction histidine kinase
MKLRDRFLLFSTAQLLLFGTAFGLIYGAFSHSVLPLFEDLIETRTEQVLRSISAELDVPLGADDPALLARTVEHVVNEPGFAYLVIRDARDRQVLGRGVPPPRPLFAGPEATAELGAGASGAWKTTSLEGLRLGSVALGFSTARIDALAGWARGIAIGVALLWMIALGYSLSFARAFASPIRAMLAFSREVAGGALSERLAIAAPGELGELRDYLNQMAAELERRHAERDASAERNQALRSELLAVTRMAGVAEVATGVLHNVGNVLNSLNVSVAMISDHVRGSRVAGLSQSIELVDRFPGGLPAFLGTEKGKVLPSYLTAVSRHLAEENARVLDELDSVNRNVEHIKAIVAIQQSYARPSGLRQPVALAELLDDALHMGESSFTHHGIEVVRDYPGDIELITDRHKLLQIVINLFSNARHALQDHDATPHRLTVCARVTEAALTISVADTGVGIPADNLERIFQHGFTTKPGGHGFGLHASAIAARELGGSLSVTSEGPGHGATFTLELPRLADEGSHDDRN